MKISTNLSLFTLVAAGLLSTGCASIDRVGAKMDMAVNRMSEQGQPEAEGRLESIEKMGVMTAIELSGGRYFDVVDASPGLMPGDIVRVYHTENGYEARLWKQAKAVEPVITETIKPVQHSGS